MNAVVARRNEACSEKGKVDGDWRRLGEGRRSGGRWTEPRIAERTCVILREEEEEEEDEEDEEAERMRGGYRVDV